MVLVPWLTYQQYGDRKILEDNYEAMRRYVDYLHRRRDDNGVIDYGLGDWYDIGPGDPGFSKLTPKALTATAIYFRDVEVMHLAATVISKTDDAAARARLSLVGRPHEVGTARVRRQPRRRRKPVPKRRPQRSARPYTARARAKARAREPARPG